MIVGPYTFIDVVSENGNLSLQPLIYLLDRGLHRYMIPTSIRYDGLRPEPVDPFPLEAEWIGEMPLVELTFPTSSRGSLRESEFYVGRVLRPLQVGKGTIIQGVNVDGLTTKSGIMFATAWGDAKLQGARGNSARTRIVGNAYRINVTHAVNRVFIQEQGGTK